MSDDIDRIDNVAGLRREDSLNPLARSKRQKRREEKADDDLTDRSKKRPAEELFILEVDSWDRKDAAEPSVEAETASDEEEDVTSEDIAEEETVDEEQETAPEEPEQGIDLKI